MGCGSSQQSVNIDVNIGADNGQGGHGDIRKKSKDTINSSSKDKSVVYEGLKVNDEIFYYDDQTSDLLRESEGTWFKAIIKNIDLNNAPNNIKIAILSYGHNQQKLVTLSWPDDMVKIAPTALTISVIPKSQIARGLRLTEKQIAAVRHYFVTGLASEISLSRMGSVSVPVEFAEGEAVDVLINGAWMPAQVVLLKKSNVQVRYDITNDEDFIDFVEIKSRIRKSTRKVLQKPVRAIKARRKSVDQVAHRDFADAISSCLKNFDDSATSTDDETVNNIPSFPSKKLTPTSKMSSRSNSMKYHSQADIAFLNRMHQAGLDIVEVEGDGNCLFRAVAHQIYLDESKHSELRTACVEHMKKHRERFEHFCTTKFDEHLRRMALPSTWGDDLEIRALEEICDRPFYIYSPDSTKDMMPMPMNTNFSESMNVKDVVPVKLSYHGRSHYNSVADERNSLPLFERKSTLILDYRQKIFEEEKIAKLKSSKGPSRNPSIVVGNLNESSPQVIDIPIS